MSLEVISTLVSQFLSLFFLFASNLGLVYFTIILFRRIAKV